MFLYLANIKDIKVTNTVLLISSPPKKSVGSLIKDPANSDTSDILQLVHMHRFDCDLACGLSSKSLTAATLHPDTSSRVFLKLVHISLKVIWQVVASYSSTLPTDTSSAEADHHTLSTVFTSEPCNFL